VGGIVEVSPGYLPLAYDKVRKAGGLCIADEVQAGFARVGSHFWGFETHGVVPDIVTMAKVHVIPIFSLLSVPCHRRRSEPDNVARSVRSPNT
jgi:alanine-glyoxylate transaminase/(R)-3-amino-2-methylpropionate-pyruvate transaminase